MKEAGGRSTWAETPSCASSTKEPRSRSRTLAETMTSRRPCSRRTSARPSTTSKSASVRSGTVTPFSRTIGRAPSWSKSSRVASAKRTTTSKRRSPSNTRPAGRPPRAMATDCATSSTVRPYRAMVGRSKAMSSVGKPVTCCTFTSAAPSTPRSTPATSPAASVSAVRSSPYSLTATSPRTPAISSLKRSSIG